LRLDLCGTCGSVSPFSGSTSGTFASTASNRRRTPQKKHRLLDGHFTDVVDQIAHVVLAERARSNVAEQHRPQQTKSAAARPRFSLCGRRNPR